MNIMLGRLRRRTYTPFTLNKYMYMDYRQLVKHNVIINFQLQLRQPQTLNKQGGGGRQSQVIDRKRKPKVVV